METAAGPAAARPPHPAPVSEPAGSVGRGARLLFPEAAGGPVRKPGRGPVANPFFPNDRKIDGGSPDGTMCYRRPGVLVSPENYETKPTRCPCALIQVWRACSAAETCGHDRPILSEPFSWPGRQSGPSLSARGARLQGTGRRGPRSDMTVSNRQSAKLMNYRDR